MKPLEPEEHFELADLERIGDSTVLLDDYDWTALHTLSLAGLTIRVESPNGDFEYQITESGFRALRIHRAYLASMVTA